jgi:Fe-S cluster biogenesis protein NfuA
MARDAPFPAGLEPAQRTRILSDMFIQTEATPNPATLKFLPGRVVLQEGTFEAKDADGAARSPLAQRLFDVPGVAGVYFGHDFISVTKADGVDEWPQVKPALLGAIMEHFQSGAPVMAEGSAQADDDAEEFYDAADHDTVVTIKDLLETRVRPAVAGDGGDITFRGYKEGVVYLEMKGACSGCPSSTATLRHGVQNLFKHFLPEIREVQAV